MSNLLQQRRIALARGQLAHRDFHLPPCLLAAQTLDHLAHLVGCRNGPLERLAAQPRKSQQVIDQAPHLGGVLTNDAQVALSFRRELRRLVFQQDVRKAIHRPQRRAQVVRNRIRERFQFLVRWRLAPVPPACVR
jgi:hypothetical protein